jgi:hypothetical protein
VDDRFYGKYRGTVVANIDPIERGRLQVKVPVILGPLLLWADPCVPYSGPAERPPIPPTGTEVWVEFEEGDRNYPIWTGVRWQWPP